MITGKQIRNGRLLAKMRSKQLAQRTGISKLTLSRFEQSTDEPMISEVTARLIQSVLEEAGVEFTNGARPGVRLRKQP